MEFNTVSTRLLHAVRVRDEGTATIGVVAAAVLGWKHPRVEGDRLEILIVLDRRGEVAEVVQKVGEVHHLFVPPGGKKGGIVDAEIERRNPMGHFARGDLRRGEERGVANSQAVCLSKPSLTSRCML